MPDDELSRAWRWRRLQDATVGEAMYLTRVHPEVDPGRPADVAVAGDLLIQHRKDRQPAR